MDSFTIVENIVINMGHMSNKREKISTNLQRRWAIQNCSNYQQGIFIYKLNSGLAFLCVTLKLSSSNSFIKDI